MADKIICKLLNIDYVIASILAGGASIVVVAVIGTLKTLADLGVL